jgi:integrase/recombinase XerD
MGKTYLDHTEIIKLEAVAANLRDRLLVRLLFRLGCRVSEALAITVDDLDASSGTARIQHLKTRLKLSCPGCGVRLSRHHSYCPGCGVKVSKTTNEEKEYRRMRTLPLDKETLEMIVDYIKRGGPIKRDDRILIFGINRHRAWQIVKECAEKAGLPKLINPETGKVHNVSPHRLRDAFAVHAVKINDTSDGLRLLQEHLGHQSFNTTARYRKISGEEHRDWYRKLWDKGDS